MTAGKYFDNNTVEVDGIVMRIWEPEHIVLPIPENRESASTSVVINVAITNNTSTPFPFVYSMLTPELLTPDGQALHPQKLMDRQITPNQSNGVAIPPKKTLIPFSIVKLSWQNNLLQLQGTTCNHLQVPTNPDPTWFFEFLQLGTYQIRFTYNHPSGEFILFDSATGDRSRVEVSRIERLATPFFELQLIEPVGTNRSAVEVDGIRFETLVPERIWSISCSRLSDASPSVQIGISITNNTSIPQRFCSFTTLIPALLGTDGLILGQNLGGGSLGWVGPEESDFHLVMPGESVTFFLTIRIDKQTDGLLDLIVNNTGRGYWLLNGLKPGAYQVQLTYRSLTNQLDMWLFEDFWRGMVHTPFVEFCLIQP